MVNNGYGKEDATSAIASGEADLVAFDRPFISNPDLVRRLSKVAAGHCRFSVPAIWSPRLGDSIRQPPRLLAANC